MKREIWNRCDNCGRFIAFADFADGTARRDLVKPDSEFSFETTVTLCKHCNAPAVSREGEPE